MIRGDPYYFLCVIYWTPLKYPVGKYGQFLLNFVYFG